MAVDKRVVEQLVYALLHAVGEDPGREGLRDTPARVARFWGEFLDHTVPASTMFEQQTSDDLVAVGPMRVWSLCEHHLLPFYADVTIGYLPDGLVLGLSKFARIAHHAAGRLQLQERLVAQIADQVSSTTRSPDVAVVARGRHLCMEMRGVKTPAITTTSVMRGRFRDTPPLRAEFMRLVLPSLDSR